MGDNSVQAKLREADSHHYWALLNSKLLQVVSTMHQSVVCAADCVAMRVALCRSMLCVRVRAVSDACLSCLFLGMHMVNQ